VFFLTFALGIHSYLQFRIEIGDFLSAGNMRPPKNEGAFYRKEGNRLKAEG